MNSKPVLASIAVSGIVVVAVLLAGAKGANSGSKTPEPTPTPAAPVNTPDKGTAGSTAPLPIGLDITWHGQSCFVMRTPGGTTILMDPVAYEIAYMPPTAKADVARMRHQQP